ncbi:MAG TPA: hypothetical protein VFL41_06545 [Gaiellaceae bacterium]|nr:hypothetical protein [Gaiellaceae bacterium]
MGFLSRASCGAILVALAVLSVASAGVNTPHSGWYSGNPLLGPNTLTDLACSGSTCYASGQFGTLLKSTDAGATWSGIVTGLTLDLAHVRLAGGAPERVLVGGGCSVRRSDDGGDTFFRLPFSARDARCPVGVASFSFPTDRVGYLLLADGRVLTTADGGRTFSRRTPVPGGASDILCTAERICFAGGNSGIQRTSDGGVSWTQAGSGSGLAVSSLERIGPLTMYAVGVNLNVLKSTDGGKTWTRKLVRNQPFANLTSIRCGDVAHCLITTQTGGQLLRTVDGGDTFTSIVPSNDATFAVEFSRPGRAVAAGGFGSAEVSDDSGATWDAVGSRIAGAFTVLAASSETVAYAGGAQGVLARTKDAGQTWQNVSPPTDAPIVGLAGAPQDRLYVLGADQSLQRSDNGGQSYRLLNPESPGPFAAVAAIGSDNLLLVGFRGVIRSTDGGETFERVQDSDVRSKLLNAVDQAPGVVVAFSPRVAALSADGGRSWSKVRLPKKRAIRDLDFATRSIALLLDSRGELWRTADAGRIWRVLPTLGTSRGRSLELADARNGYVVVNQFGSLNGLGLVLRTSDGGRTWHPQLVGRSSLDAVQSGGATDYALGAGASLYATTVRGDVGAPQSLTLSTQRRALARPARVVVGGRLSPADGGEEIVVARLARGRWSVQLATAASNGSFSTRWRLDDTSVFVAQVLGDADHAGAGTRPLTVTVLPRRKS